MARYDGSAHNCIFCRIVNAEVPAHTFWESETHMAFLSIFPNTEGFSVVIPKNHQPSAVLELPEEEYSSLMQASKEAAAHLKNGFDDVGRVAIIIEGLGVDHAHTKLVPLHGTASLEDTWSQHSSQVDMFYKTYQGYVCSHDGPRMDDSRLKKIVKQIQSRNP